MKVVYSKESLEELYNVTDFYKKIDAEIVRNFKIEIKKVESTLEKSPEIYKIRYKLFRRVNLKNYPFSIFFKIDKSNIKIVKIIHQSRDPVFWP